MNKIKLMSVSYQTINAHKRPQIILKGDFLIDAGFSHEELVACSYKDGILTLQAQGKGMAIYQNLVREIRKNKQHLCQVLDQTRHYQKNPYLIIDGVWLSRLGFKAGQVILCRVKQSVIEIEKINLSNLGFDNLDFSITNETTYKLIQVQKSSHHGKVVPMIQLKGAWLLDVGFHAHQSVLVTYEFNGMTFRACRGKKLLNSTGGKPPHINMHYERNKKDEEKIIPFFQLKGHWILEHYDIGDYLILQIKYGVIYLKRLDNKMGVIQ